MEYYRDTKSVFHNKQNISVVTRNQARIEQQEEAQSRIEQQEEARDTEAQLVGGGFSFRFRIQHQQAD